MDYSHSFADIEINAIYDVQAFRREAIHHNGQHSFGSNKVLFTMATWCGKPCIWAARVKGSNQ
jgi:hypothetical protein